MRMRKRGDGVRRKLAGIMTACVLMLLLVTVAVHGAVVQIPDANLAKALKSELGATSVTTERMAAVTQLNLANKGIGNLKGMETATNLTNLSLAGNPVSDLSALSGLSKLETLDLSRSSVTSLNALSDLKALRVLHIEGCAVQSLEGILSLPKLQFLFCGYASMDLSEGSVLASQIASLRARGTYVVVSGGDNGGDSGTSSGSTSSGTGSVSSCPASSTPSSGSASSSVSSVPEPKAEISAKNGATVVVNRNGNTVGNVEPGTNVPTLLSQLNGNGYTLRVVNGKGTQVSGTLMTGMKVQLLKNGAVADELTVLVRGDCNGDGKLTLTDMMQVKAHLLKKTELNGALLLAADYSGDGNVSLTDFVQVKAKLLGK